MKKIAFIAALLGSAILTLTAAEAPKLPGWHATAEEYTACAAGQPDTPHGVQIRRTSTLMARVVTDKPATYADYCGIVDNVRCIGLCGGTGGIFFRSGFPAGELGRFGGGEGEEDGSQKGGGKANLFHDVFPFLCCRKLIF